MTEWPAKNSLERYSDALAARTDETYVLRLYVAGTTERSAKAVQQVKRICEEHLAGRYTLQVIDIYQQPQLARGDQIVAVPTLIKKLPHPLRVTIGAIAQSERLLVGLDLVPTGERSST